MARALYFTYDGLLDPLGQSQIIPYISAVAVHHSLTIVSYEKEQRSQEQIRLLDSELQVLGIRWERLVFRPGKFWAIKRILSGIFLIRKLCKWDNPDFVHLRGMVPAVIYRFSRSRYPYLYDFRGFALDEWVEMGKIMADSPVHRILRRLDQDAVYHASGLVVLEHYAERLLKKTYNVPDVPFKVIRTCTDVSRYKIREQLPAGSKRDCLRFVFLGGARSPYRPDLALRLIKGLLEHGQDCHLDFINERDHSLLREAIDLVSISGDKVRIVACEQQEIPAALAAYDCGIIIIDSSPWRRVCSPTKLGEYLAAGLPVLSMEGIDITDELSERTSCVKTISRVELEDDLRQDTIDQILTFIRQKGITSECWNLACDEFSMEKAGALYVELYSEMERRVSR